MPAKILGNSCMHLVWQWLPVVPLRAAYLDTVASVQRGICAVQECVLRNCSHATRRWTL